MAVNIERPKTIDEAAKIVADAHAAGRRVWPKGGGTRHAPPEGGELVVIDLTKLNRMVEHVPEDLVASVECGMTWAEFQGRLAEKAHQRVPLEPFGDEGSTVGGVLATNAAGPLKLRYGTARDWLIGATVIRFDGKIIRSGGMVVKNVSGYDLHKLHLGSWGTLGIMAQANFKLTPIPKERQTQVLELPREEAFRMAIELWEQPVPLVSAVYSGRLYLQFEGGKTIATNSSGPPAKDVRLDLPAPGKNRSTHFAGAVIRIHYPPASYLRIMDQIQGFESEYTLLGCGVTWLNFRHPPPMDPLRKICAVVVDESAPPEFPNPVMAQLKAALDPKQTFPVLA